MINKFVTVKESAEYLATSTRSIYRFINNPVELNNYIGKQIRIHKSDLDVGSGIANLTNKAFSKRCY